MDNHQNDEQQVAEQMPWLFRLYQAGSSADNSRIRRNLETLCREGLNDSYEIEVIDILKDPDRASTDQVLAVPLVVRISPLPQRRAIGNLSDQVKARTCLGIGNG